MEGIALEASIERRDDRPSDRPERGTSPYGVRSKTGTISQNFAGNPNRRADRSIDSSRG